MPNYTVKLHHPLRSAHTTLTVEAVTVEDAEKTAVAQAIGFVVDGITEEA